MVCILTAGRVNLKLLKMKKLVFTAFAVGLSLTVSVLAQVPNYVPTNGLVGYWPFNGNANDESGNGNNGTVNGATLTTDRFGVASKAYSFDGAIQNIQTNYSGISGNNDRSIQLWFNQSITNSTINEWSMLGYGGTTFGSGYSLCVFPQGAAQNSIGTDIGNGYLFYNPSPVLNQWNHLIATYSNLDGNNLQSIKIYLNGVLLTNYSATYNLNLNFNTGNINNLFFGCPSSFAGAQFLGKLDDIGIWNRALTQEEITNLFLSCSNNLTLSPTYNIQNIGGNTTFTATTSDLNPTFTWQSNPSNFGWQNIPANSTYSGINTNTLVVNNIQLANHNQPFRVIASSGNCTDTSNIATIQIADTCITNVTVYDTLLTTVTDTLIINTTLSLPAPNNENTILIYPNPASDHITIDNGNFTAMAGYSIKIENNAGQQVFQSAINQAQFYVDLSTWTGNGLYFVHLSDPQNNTVTVRKIVLQ